MKLSQRIVFSAGILAVIAMVPAEVRAASLWVKSGNVEQSMFADSRARNIGDILKVEMDEDVTTEAKTDIFTTRKGDIGGGVGLAMNNFLNQFLRAVPSLLGAAKGPVTTTGNTTTVPVGGAFGNVDIPTIDFAGQSKYEGGKNELTDTVDVSGTTSVTVVDVLPNGNLVVEGAKIIRTSKQDIYSYMRGIVRPVDISATNTIPSSKIADAQVEFIPAGELSDAQKKGWLIRGWEKVRPF